MAKFTLTVASDNASEIMSLMQFLQGGTAVVSFPTPAQFDAGEAAEPMNTAAPMTDARGLPWDERIHAASKAIVADGSWRKRKNVNEGTLAAVEAELRARVGSPQAPSFQTPVTAPMAPPQMPPQQPMQPAYQPPPPGTYPQAPVAPQPAYQPPPMAPPQQPVYQPPVQPQPVQPQQPPAADFSGLMSALQRGMSQLGADGQPLINQAYLADLTQRIAGGYGIALGVITELQSHPDKIGYAMQLLQQDGRLV